MRNGFRWLLKKEWVYHARGVENGMDERRIGLVDRLDGYVHEGCGMLLIEQIRKGDGRNA